jgi:O-antigen/teichoic acid export membrane protein
MTVVFFSPTLRPRLDAFDGDEAKRLTRSGLVFFLLSVTTFIGIYADPIIISRILGVEAVAEYAVVQRLSQVAIIFQAFITALWPVYGEALARGDVIWVRDAFYKVLFASLFLGILLAFSLMAYGPNFVNFWTNNSIKPSPTLFAGFAFYIVVTALIGSLATILNLSKFLGFQLILLLVTSTFSVALKYWFISFGGVSGAIWATSVAFLMFFVLPGYAFVNVELFRSSLPSEKRS